jgi:hypothetical protein
VSKKSNKKGGDTVKTIVQRLYQKDSEFKRKVDNLAEYYEKVEGLFIGKAFSRALYECYKTYNFEKKEG